MTALFLRPDADQSDGGWLNESSSGTNIYTSVDEASTPVDTDYIQSSTTDGDKVRLRLSDPSSTVVAPLIVRYRCKRVGTTACNVIGQLYEGTSPGTQRATWTQLAVPASFTTYTYTLTSGEFSSITDFTNLYVEFELSQQASLKVDLNFAAGVYYDSGTTPADATGCLSCTRASIGYAKTLSGTLTQFASNALRITDLGLLVEDTRTNDATYSQDFSNSHWQKFNGASVGGTTTAPDGTSTAQLYLPGVGSGAQEFHADVTPSVGTGAPYTFSIYAKNGGYNYAQLTFFQSTSPFTNWSIVVDLTTGVIATDTGTSVVHVTSVETLASGWFRLIIATTLENNDGQVFRIIGSSSTTINPIFAGDGSSGVYFWGAQCEPGAFASSYIPTTSAAATRAADLAPFIGNLDTVASGAAGSVVMSYTDLDVTFGQYVLLGYFGGTNRYMFYATSNTLIGNYNVADVGLATTTIGNSQTNLGGTKAGTSWNATDGSVVGGGGTVNSAANQDMGVSGYKFAFSTFYPYLIVRRLTIWNSKLADATLQGFTYP